MCFLILLLNLNIICVNKTLLHKPKLPPVRRCYEGQGVHTKISQRNLFLAAIWQLWFPFRAAVTTVYTTWQGGYQQYHWVCLLDRSKSQISCKTNYLQENIKELKASEIKLANQHSRVQSYIQQSQRNCLNILQKRQILLSAKGKKKKVQYFIAWNWNHLTTAMKNIFYYVIEETLFLSILPRLLLMKCYTYNGWWRFEKDIKHFKCHKKLP